MSRLRLFLCKALVLATALWPWIATVASDAEGSFRFTAMPAEATGVKAPNAYTDLLGRFEDIMRGSLGSGVALADLNSDGRPDILVASKVEGLRYFTNQGGFVFRDETAAAGFSPDRVGTPQAPVWYQGVSAVDVNGDGLLDVYVCRIGAPNQLFINQGDGHFVDEAAARGVALVDGSNMAAFADYDRDGWLDFYLQTNIYRKDHPQGEPDRLFRNLGFGYFVETTQAAGLHGVTQGHGLVWCDYDDDGWPDVYVANDFEEPDRLYRNNGDGTFRDVIAEVMPSISNSSMGVDSADVDNDGRLDLFVADMAAMNPEQDLRGMVNRRLNGMEPLDRPEALRQYPANTLLLNTGVGRFVEAAAYAGVARTGWTWSVLFGDFDQDGRVDLHVTNGVFRELHNIELSARSGRAASEEEQLAILKKCPVYREPNQFFLNRSSAKFEECAAAVGLEDVGVSFGAATADLDGDGDLDLVYNQFRKDPAVFRNDFARGKSILVDLRSRGNNRFGIGAKVTLKSTFGVQVRDLQQARGYLSTSEPVVHFGLPPGDEQGDLEIRWPDGKHQKVPHVKAGRRVVVTEDGDFQPNSDSPENRKPTWWVDVASRVGMDVRQREAATTELSRQPLVPEVFNRAGPAVVSADLNGDGLEDFVVGATTRDAGMVFLSNGHGGYRSVSFDEGALMNRGPVVAADFFKVGHPQLLVTSGGTTAPAGDAAYKPELWDVSALGMVQRVEKQALPPALFPVGAVAVADFDHDGWLDMVLGGRVVPGRFPEAAPVAYWKGGPQGFTASPFPALAGDALKSDEAPQRWGLVTALLATDVDGDGWPDLLVAREWGTLMYWHNRQGKGFEDSSAQAGLDDVGTGLWTSLCAGDFNGDGRMDYVVGNQGLNTSLAAMPGEKAVLYHGNIPGIVEPQVLEVVKSGEREWPRRGLASLSQVFRDLPRRFPSNDRFAAAGIEGLFKKEVLSGLHRLELSEKRSGLLLSAPGGRFHFEPLPWQAQLAPLQGMLAVDVNGDGNLDLVACQNSFDPIPEHGRADAGLGVVLLGDGRGAFHTAPTAETGWVVPGDARGLAVADFDRNGCPDFMVTRNNRNTQVLLYQASAAGRRWRVVLAPQSPGAGTPWGSVITVCFRDGTRQATELSPVTSRMSQSAPYAFVAEPSDRSIDKVEVRWPDGKLLVYPWPPLVQGTVVLKPDGAVSTAL